MFTRITDTTLKHTPMPKGQAWARSIILLVGLVVAIITITIVLRYGNIGI